MTIDQYSMSNIIFEKSFKNSKQIYLVMNDLPKLSYRNDVISQLHEPSTSLERGKVLKMLYFAVESLYSNGIYIYPNVIELFRINGFKKTPLYNDAVFYVTENISKEIKCNLKWINRRSFRKSNSNDKNIVICYLLFLYHKYFIKYLQDFLSKKEPNKEKIARLISSLEHAVENVPKKDNQIVQPLINYNKGIPKKVQKPKDIKTEKNNVHDNFFFVNDQDIKDIPDYDLFSPNDNFCSENEFDLIPF